MLSNVNYRMNLCNLNLLYNPSLSFCLNKYCYIRKYTNTYQKELKSNLCYYYHYSFHIIRFITFRSFIKYITLIYSLPLSISSNSSSSSLLSDSNIGSSSTSTSSSSISINSPLGSFRDCSSSSTLICIDETSISSC